MRRRTIWSAILVYFGQLGLAWGDNPQGLTAQTVKVPSGPASLTGLGESFDTNGFTGMGTYSVPLEVPPAPLMPSLGLRYTAGRGQGALGLSFDIPVMRIYRTTDKGMPAFGDDDRMAVMGPDINGELVWVSTAGHIRRYRLKNEGAFALFEWDLSNDHWTIRLPNGHKLKMGSVPGSRQQSSGRTFGWWLGQHVDAMAVPHSVDYVYEQVHGYPYLTQVSYRNEGEASTGVHIHFTYGPRPYTTRDFRYGVEIQHSQLLERIEVREGDSRTLTTYHFLYNHQELYSLLSSVDRVGEHGERMPTLHFSYYGETAGAGRMRTMSSVPSVGMNALAEGRARLEDVTGDGLTDLLVGEEGSAWYYHRNLDGVEWDKSSQVLRNSPSMPLGEEGVVLADMDGDGFRDVAYVDENTIYYEPHLGVVDGVFQGYGDPIGLRKDDWQIDFQLTDTSVRLIDVNFDGRTDVIRVYGSIQGEIHAYVNLPGDVLDVDNEFGTVPVGVEWDSPLTRLADMNGDGLLDIIAWNFDWETSEVRVWYGLGGGAFSASSESMTNVPLGYNDGMTFLDINRDGQLDILRYGNNEAKYYLNRGDGGFTGEQEHFINIPDPLDYWYRDEMDMNGNGTADYFWIERDWQISYLDFIEEPYKGLLSTIDNGMGLVTEIIYRSSTDYAIEAREQGEGWRTTLPHPVPVIAEVHTTDSMHEAGVNSTYQVVTYDYYDGYYDGSEREFRGFGRVRTTEWGTSLHETLVKETVFHLGRDLDTGADEEALKGRTILSKSMNLSGEVYSSREVQYSVHWLCQALLAGPDVLLPLCDPNDVDGNAASKDERVALALTQEVLTASWEKTQTPRYSAERMFYDSEDLPWGKVSRSEQLGEVTLSENYLPGRGFKVGQSVTEDSDGSPVHDESYYEVDYLYGLGEHWLIGLPYERRTLDADGSVLLRHQTFYDGNTASPSDAGSLTAGLETWTQSWLDTPSGAYNEQDDWVERPVGWVTDKRIRYTEHGQPAEVSDGLGRTRSYTYHSAVPSLPVKEVLPVGTESAPATLSFVADYDTGFGVVTETTGMNGHTAHYQYDGLGRLTRIVNHLGDVQSCFQYSYGRPVSTTVVETLYDRDLAGTCGQSSPAAGYRREVIYSDGAGRARLSKVLAEDSEGSDDPGYVGTGWMVLSGRGEPVVSYYDFFSAHEGFEPAPETAYSSYQYLDALSREVRRFLPVTQGMDGVSGFVQSGEIVYAPFLTRRYSERQVLEGTRLYPHEIHIDGRGRVVHVARSNAGDGNAEVTDWYFDYDARGLLTTVGSQSETGPGVVQRSYGYDSLGRLRVATADELGERRYDYDDVGNVTRKRMNPLDRVVGVRYDRSDRPLMRTVSGLVGEEVESKVYRWFYDSEQPEYAEQVGQAPENVAGRLVGTSFPTGRTFYSYDPWGRITSELVELWDPELPGSTVDDQRRDWYLHQTRYNLEGHPIDVGEGDALATAQFDGLRKQLSFNARGLTVEVWAGLDGQLKQIFSDIRYDAEAKPLAAVSANGIRACRGYDARRQLNRLVVGPSAEIQCEELAQSGGYGVQNIQYNWGADGLLTSVEDLTSESLLAPGPDGLMQRARPRLDASYGYDYLGQLTSVAYGDARFGQRTYEYDGLQNLTRRRVELDGIDPVETQYHYGENGHGPTQLSGVAGAQMYGLDYNELGELRYYNDYQLTFDADGLLARADAVEGDHIEFHYDAMGKPRIELSTRLGELRRVKRHLSEQFHILDGEPSWLVGGGTSQVEIRRAMGVRVDSQLLDTLSAYVAGGGKSAGYIPPLPVEYMDLNGDGSSDFDAADLALAEEGYWAEAPVGGAKELWTYYHNDLLKASTHVTDAAGNLSSLQQFYPFGTSSFSHGIRPRLSFAGNERGLEQDLGLMRMGVRHYAPELNRWVSADPLFLEDPSRCVDRPLECNLYSYGANNPVLHADREGTFIISGTIAGAYLAYRVYSAYSTAKDVVETADMLSDPNVSTSDKALKVAEVGADVLLGKAGGAAVKYGGDMVRKGADVVAESKLGQQVADRIETAVDSHRGRVKGRGGDCFRGCFLAGTLVASALVDVPLEEIRVGDRVLTHHAESATEIDENWVHVGLYFDSETASGDRYSVEMLRPREWLALHGVSEVGDKLYIDISDADRGRWATVALYRPAPKLAPGPGRVVISTFNHLSDDVYEVGFGDGVAPLRGTGSHPLYSLDRDDWVRVRDLQIGERLQTAKGAVSVEALEKVRGLHRVYNFEVEGAHEYLVGEAQIRAHNAGPVPDTPGVYIITNKSANVSYVGSAGIGEGGMATRMYKGKHKKAHELLEMPGTTVEYKEVVNIPDSLTASERNNILRHFENIEYEKQVKAGYTMTNDASIQALDKRKPAEEMIEREGISAKRRRKGTRCR